jgi:hypothetical protein
MMRIKVLFTLSILFLTGLPLVAQEVDSISIVEEYDEYEETASDSSENYRLSVSPEELISLEEYKQEPFPVHKFDSLQWKALTDKSNYEEKKEEKAETFRPSAPSIPWSGNVLRAIAFIIILAVVVLIIYFVVKNTSLENKIKSKQQSLTDLSKPVESIEELDIDHLLKEAIRTENYKAAVRLYFLSLLKKFNASGSIVWKKDKTNHDYLIELFSKPYFEQMKGFTLAYERVWYGEHFLSQESFRSLERDFKSLEQQATISNAS